MPDRSYYVYIMANRSGTIYIGVTNDLERRVAEHKARRTPGFTARYNVTRLVYYEDTNAVWAALEREKELKGWRRSLKGWRRSKESSLDPADESALGGLGPGIRGIGAFARLP